jgi:1,4-dihydroxy-2-naphthoyl-CoA synthase
MTDGQVDEVAAAAATRPEVKNTPDPPTVDELRNLVFNALG